jgi:ABC-type transport system substrate-binding protein
VRAVGVPLGRLALPGLALMALVAARAPAALGPRYGGELRVGVLDLPSSLVPAPVPGVGPRLLAGLVHETLVGLGADGEPTPGLAEAWEPAAEGREWTLSLGGNARFHDDRAVTADDVVRSLRVFLRSPGTAATRLARGLEGGPAFRARRTDDLPGLVALDPRRVRLRFASASFRPLAPLASPGAAISGAAGAGAGPFVPALFVPGRRAVLSAFAGHPRGRPFLDRVQVTTFADPGALAAEARAGRIDLAAGEPGIEAPAAELLLLLDAVRPPFDRAEARAALVAAIDRSFLMSRLVPGGEPSPDLLPPTVWPPTPAGDAPPAPAPSFTHAGTVTLAVSRDVPPPVSQRVLAHVTALGLRARVMAVTAPEALVTPAELRLVAFSPEVPEPALALEELLALVPDLPGVRGRLEAADATGDVARRRAGLARIQDTLVRFQAIAGLGRLPIRFGGRAEAPGGRVDAAGRLVLEDAWVPP